MANDLFDNTDSPDIAVPTWPWSLGGNAGDQVPAPPAVSPGAFQPPQAAPLQQRPTPQPPSTSRNPQADLVRSILLPILLKSSGPAAVTSFLQEHARLQGAYGQQQQTAFENQRQLNADQQKQDADQRQQQHEIAQETFQQGQLTNAADKERQGAIRDILKSIQADPDPATAWKLARPQLESLQVRPSVLNGIEQQIPALSAPSRLQKMWAVKEIEKQQKQYGDNWMEPANQFMYEAPGVPQVPNPQTGAMEPGRVPLTDVLRMAGQSLPNGQALIPKVEKTPPLDSTQLKEVQLPNGKRGWATFDPKTKTFVPVDTPMSPPPSAASVQITAGALSGPALDQATQKYLDTGQLPPGYGAAGVSRQTAVMNNAALVDPTAGLARNAAKFKADQANLVNLQRTEGTLSAFETTAGKNLDQFLTLAKDIPDTGVPWLNTPVRQLTQQVVGRANMAAINAARDVALREIARVTSDPKLSGALTDAARQEVSSLSPQNATLPQIRAVANVLKQDMANVHAGLNAQIQQVRQGIGSKPATGSENAVTSDPLGLFK